MINKIITFILTGASLLRINAQNISMNFPHFAGKTYDFIVFQGDEQKTVLQGTIPNDGKFTLSIPKEFTPYIGMSRWLITGTQEGGGLDMLIPGEDFSVHCTEKKPDPTNIKYERNPQNDILKQLFKEQNQIITRKEAMEAAIKAYEKTHKHYNIFEQEYNDQHKIFLKFQDKVNKSGYAGKLLQIINIMGGLGTELYDSDEKTAKNISDYIANNIDWNVLYTSGHWTNIIASWISIHTQIIKDRNHFTEDFKKITQRIDHEKLYTDFSGRTAFFLAEQGVDDYIAAIAPIVVSSGKIKTFEGSLSSYLQENTKSIK